MKAKVALLAAALESWTHPSSQLYHGTGDPVGGPHSDETNELL
jgi:hypothetical protein